MPSHIPIRADWLEQLTESALNPSLPIVDPHHHLWLRDDAPYFLYELLADTSSGHNITATVFVECHAMYRRTGPESLRPVGEVEFANGVAAMSASETFGPTKAVAGIIGNANLSLGEAVEPVIEALAAAGGGRFRGVRDSCVWHEDPEARGSSLNTQPELALDPQFQAGVRVLARNGFSFDAWAYHTQLNDIAALARAVPEATIVLNHVGGAIGIGPYAGQRDEVFAHWKQGIEEVASCPNVNVKLGGLGMRLFGFDVHTGDLPPSSDVLATAWRPYLETCIEAFGPERAMFESNFPVDKGSCSYTVLWNAFKRVAEGASATATHALFSETATRVYRLG